LCRYITLYALRGSRPHLFCAYFAQAKDELLSLLARFADNTSPQPILDAVERLYDAAREDAGLREWFGRLREWSRRVSAGSMLLPPCPVADLMLACADAVGAGVCTRTGLYD
jgi:Family of unknown function (DUF5923)